jgi:hypothetical protein
VKDFLRKKINGLRAADLSGVALGRPRSGGLLGLDEAKRYAAVQSRSDGPGVVFLADAASASQSDTAG